jgi:hypothetical protein
MVSNAWAGPFTFQKGDIVASVGNGLENVFDPTGTFLTTLDTTTGSQFTAGGAFDSNGNLFVTDFSASTVTEFDKNGTLVTASFGSGYNAHPESVTINSANNIFVGQADGSRQVLEFTNSGSPVATFSPMTENRGTDWIDLAPDGHTLYYTSEGHNIMRFDISTDTQLSNFATGLPGANAYALRLLANGDVLVADTSEAILLDTNGNIVRTYVAPGATILFAINILPDGKSFLTGDLSSGEIYQFNIATGVLENQFNSNIQTALGGIIVFGEQGIGPPPIPEPGTLVMFGTGVLGLAGLIRRKLS